MKRNSCSAWGRHLLLRALSDPLPSLGLDASVNENEDSYREAEEQLYEDYLPQHQDEAEDSFVDMKPAVDQQKMEAYTPYFDHPGPEQ